VLCLGRLACVLTRLPCLRYPAVYIETQRKSDWFGRRRSWRNWLVDETRFDALTRSLAGARSRRTLIRSMLSLGGGIVAVGAGRQVTDAARRGYAGPCLPSCREVACGQSDGCGGTCGCAAGLMCAYSTCFHLCSIGTEADAGCEPTWCAAEGICVASVIEWSDSVGFDCSNCAAMGGVCLPGSGATSGRCLIPT